MVSDAEVWRMNNVAVPSLASASFTNFATSAVRSMKPCPEVCTVRTAETMVSARIVDSAVRDIDLGAVMRPQIRVAGHPRPEERALTRVSKDEKETRRP